MFIHICMCKCISIHSFITYACYYCIVHVIAVNPIFAVMFDVYVNITIIKIIVQQHHHHHYLYHINSHVKHFKVPITNTSSSSSFQGGYSFVIASLYSTYITRIYILQIVHVNLVYCQIHTIHNFIFDPSYHDNQLLCVSVKKSHNYSSTQLNNANIYQLSNQL